MNKLVMASLMFAALASQPVSAAAVWCNGKIDAAYVASDGRLVINGAWRNESGGSGSGLTFYN